MHVYVPELEDPLLDCCEYLCLRVSVEGRVAAQQNEGHHAYMHI
jgi:hypothetical protein